MPFFLGLVFAFVAILVLAWPILRRGHSAHAPAAPPDAVGEVAQRRARIYEDIKTLALDYELGNVPAEEYSAKLAAFRLEAARALRDQEQLQQTQARLEDDLENQVLELRRSWGSVTETMLCEVCGREVGASAALCPRCELPLGHEAASRDNPSTEGKASWAGQ